MKRLLFVVLFLTCVTVLKAQTLFTYGRYSVDVKEFLRAYNKNNTAKITDRERSVKDYLDLYIRSRLKVREAYDRRYDTLPQIRTEIENLRTQIMENYMADPEMTARMTSEAFDRSQKDVHVAHIFISFRNANGIIDTAAAIRKRDEILNRLKKEDFSVVARQSSDDTTAKQNGGDIGYITAFTLPYEFETAIYNTPGGQISKPVRSSSGFHIFKILDYRKAAGKIKAQQILLAIPPFADESMKKDIARRADSLYKRILAGDNFNKLANDFSNDYMTGVTGGILPEISVGAYDPAFEKVLFSLPKDGAVSKPFMTRHGWHIVKRISSKPVVTDPANKENLDELKQKIGADSRWKTSRDFIYNKVMANPGFKEFKYDEAAFWNMTDSVIDRKPMRNGWSITATTPLFAIGDSVYDANDWVNYAYTYRYKQDGSGPKPWKQVREEWIKYALLNYYRDHLADYNEEYRNQMTEFTEGNLFFEIMQVEVWNKAQNDSIALLELYNNNKKNYMWVKSADAIMFFCSDLNTAKAVYEKVKANPSNWRKIVEGYTEKVIADSSKYEWEQIPNLKKAVPRPGMITSPELNPSDNTASFAMIVNVYASPTQRTFNEARGMVINDYQLVLEKKWEEELRKKFPVVINQEVLADIIR
jgi:peptidyl-prolyl cis-trans isomerase SurA